ncbi:hypothetical protein GCM10023168_30840 [Fodinibacter luteus]|uniref:AB hydrolase-1 domain-containing protein n=1 Tax=Fodinibacter luteus TaxID=552064 RepID=A0ABP8KN98_9MICO
MRTRLGALHVRIVGSGPVTVLWPSMFVDGHTWDRLLPHLAADRRYVLVDGPGLGRSEPLRRRSSIGEAADAAVDLLDGLGVDAPVDWVGNAFGGHVGFDLATREGVLRSLVAVSAPTEPITPELRRQIALLAPVLRLAGAVRPVRDSVVEAMLTQASAADPQLRAVVVDSLRRPGRRSLSLALRSFILDRADVNDTLGDIRVPSLFVASDDRGDWSPQDAVRAAALTPAARAVVVDGARTLVPLEQPVTLARLLRDFWAEVDGSEAPHPR